MRHFSKCIIGALALVFAGITPSAKAQTEAPAPGDKKANAAIAVIMAANIEQALDQLSQLGLEGMDRAEIAANISSYLNGTKPEITFDDANRYIDSLVYAAHPDISAKVSEESQKVFIDQVAATDGAIVTPSGLVFIVETEGEGPHPTIKDRVNVTYTGRLSDGTEFDSTGEETVTFDVAGVVPGFSEGLQMMRPGGTYRIVIPYTLAYGPEGIPGIIPGNSALDFTVTLQSISPAQ